jgi:aminopeptidase-like protein
MINVNKIFDELFPICRSITGQGYRSSFNIIKKFIPFKKHKYPTGKKVFDWTVPNEWNIREAYIQNSAGKKIIDFNQNNLHLMSYSIPVNKRISLSELNRNLHSIPHMPKDIPYVTSYYKKNWGFCLSHKQRLKLANENYKVFINSSLKKGFVEWGEFLLKKTVKDKSVKKDTILITSYLCHPSMANNELSGPLIQILLYLKLKKLKQRKFNYLFVINPETIGSICFIHKNLKFLKENIFSGLVLTCLGGPQKKLSYKLSRMGDSVFDRYFKKLAKSKKIDIRKFDPTGSDERQYCSSEVNLPIGQLARTVYGKNKEYHTSADNKKFVKLEKFEKTANEIFDFIRDNENQTFLRRQQPYCELQLGKRGLYPNINSPLTQKDSSDEIHKSKAQLNIIQNILTSADGVTSLSDLKISSIYKEETIKHFYEKLKKKNLIY